MHVSTEQKPYDTINVTPMLDLAYVLLVVFILMTTATVQGLSITLPRPSAKPSAEAHPLHIVQVLPGGALLFDGVPLAPAELESRLQAARAEDPKTSVAIKGDAKSAYAQVVAVIDLCNRLQLDMALVTSRIGT